MTAVLQWPGYHQDFLTASIKSTTGHITTAMVVEKTLQVVREVEKGVKVRYFRLHYTVNVSESIFSFARKRSCS